MLVLYKLSSQMIMCITCALLLTKSWTYSCIFSTYILCNLIVITEDGSLWDALGSLGGCPPSDI
jgi:hypothetical protein